MKEKHSESNDGAKCCGFSELLEERRELRRRRNKPQPWIMRKLAVIITIALAIYAHYVYIGRFCVRMIRRDAGAMGSRNMGIAFLVVFLVLAIMFWWTYAMVIFTPPGFATDYVKTKTLPPGSSEDRATPEWWNAHGNYDQYEAHDPSREINGQARPSFRGPDRPNGVHSEKRSEVIRQNGRGDTEAGVLDSIPVKAPKASRPDESEADEPQRRPPDHPQLAPEYWYCSKDQIVKPVRTHHCRACGRCVLQYDHHCPWVGQCVGAHNHKFFYNFVQWSTLWTGWSFATLVARNAKFNIDGQEIAIIVLTGFFTIFTLAMILAHTRLILLNMTTVESLRINDMRAREKNELREITGFFEFRKRRAIKKRWDREWGSLNTEGNIWYQDNLRANWEATMGKSVWGWFLPIGRSEGDGLTYPINPRFDADGRWRRREQWPAELR